MRKIVFGLLGFSLAAGLFAGTGGLAQANPDVGKPTSSPQASHAVQDDLSSPQEDKRRALRERALRMVLNGQAKVQTINGSKVVKIGQRSAPLTAAQQAKVRAGQKVKAKKVDQYVELARTKTDKIFVVLTEFGNERNPNYPDQDTDPDIAGPTVFDGPLHNAIPEPDRAKDNSTVWQPDYSAAYFRNLYFGKGKGVQSLKTYYEKQSSGRYSVDGAVTDWVKVRYNEARYGRSDGYPCATNVCSNTWNLLQDGVAQWVADRKAAGRTDADIKNALTSYDKWDRNDYDGDGNFNEPDGYLDHFQIVHSGGDQADGDPYQGEDAIWSHRWKAFQNSGQGPAGNKDGGFQVGTTGLWIADYTIQPENGGLSVFTHEYGHDLGLPDLYDTAGTPQDAVSFWSLMAQSRLSAKNDEGIGTRPGDLGAWEKLQLGWLDYETALAGDKRTFKLGPHEYNTKKPQGLVVVLPKKAVVDTLATPYEGSKSWWSDAGDDLDNSMSRSVTLPAGSPVLNFRAQYDIEDCDADPCDYAYVEVDDGTGWKAIPGNITKAAEGNGIEGTTDGWVPATFDLSAYAGKTVGLRVRYVSDGAAQGNDDEQPDGIFVDALSITAGGVTVFADGAETSPNGWTLDGFASVGATRTRNYDNYYIASYRAYVSFDRYLKTGPYNFGYATTLPDYVEHFPYQNGLLVSYWDTSHTDNDVSSHPGEGEILPVDAHPQPITRLDGVRWRPRVALYDATFGRERADSFTLHVDGVANYIRGQAAQPKFDDTRTYWYDAAPLSGVRTPGVGVTLKVTKQAKSSMTVKLGTSKPVSPADVRASIAKR